MKGTENNFLEYFSNLLATFKVHLQVFSILLIEDFLFLFIVICFFMPVRDFFGILILRQIFLLEQYREL